MIKNIEKLWGFKISYIVDTFSDYEDFLEDFEDIEEKKEIEEMKIEEKEKEVIIVKKVSIFLNSVEKVKQFVNIASKLDCDLDLSSGRYMIDGKSIMGIFSLNLSKPIEVYINTKHDMEHILSELNAFII